jgi:hypothetical protein
VGIELPQWPMAMRQCIVKRSALIIELSKQNSHGGTVRRKEISGLGLSLFYVMEQKTNIYFSHSGSYFFYGDLSHFFDQYCTFGY